jgi:opacity protein-like surface antigen
VALSGCSSGNGLSVKVSGAKYSAASGVSCVPSNGSVTVSGSFTAVGRPDVIIVPSAKIYDSSGNQVGHVKARWTSVNAGKSTPIQFTVNVNGTPASCHVTWGAITGLPD